MAITAVGASQGISSVVTGTTIALSRTAGAINNLLVVAVGYNLGTGTPTIGDTQGNAWTPADPVFNDGTNTSTMMSWYALAKNTTSTTITVTTPSCGFRSMTLDEFTGTDITSPLDQVFHSVAGASGTPTSPSFTPSVDDTLAWAYTLDSVTAVGNIDGSAATKGGDDGSQDWSEFRVLVGRSGVAMTAAFGGSGAYDLIGATFKPPSGVVTGGSGVDDQFRRPSFMTDTQRSAWSCGDQNPSLVAWRDYRSWWG